MNEESKIELEKIMKEINIKNDKLLKDIGENEYICSDYWDNCSNFNLFNNIIKEY